MARRSRPSASSGSISRPRPQHLRVSVGHQGDVNDFHSHQPSWEQISDEEVATGSTQGLIIQAHSDRWFRGQWAWPKEAQVVGLKGGEVSGEVWSSPGFLARQPYAKTLIVRSALWHCRLEVSLHMLGERSPDEPHPRNSEVF